MLPMDYGTTAARFLLGVTAHPGGTALTGHLLDRLALPPAAVVADVACGRGTTVAMLRKRGHVAVGIDLSATQVIGDAQRLPLRSSAFDAVLLECSLSTFDRPEAALAEVARVLRPGGVLGLTDIVLDRGRAPAQVVRAIDRLTSARTVQGYADLLAAAGLHVIDEEDRSHDASQLLRRLRRRLPLSRTVRACESAVRSGTLSYGLLVACRQY